MITGALSHAANSRKVFAQVEKAEGASRHML